MPEDIEILPVEIHLPGLLKLLGEHLYSDPKVAVREMMQNAHDSCTRRREEDPAVAAGYEPAIALRLDREHKQLVIEDNGSGLTRDEIVTFLATVGRGYTGELRERLGGAGRAEALDLIGLFGLGLLSAFMIASRIEITTASYQTPVTAWRWISEGGQSYALRRTTREAVGTTVRLDLRDEALFLLEPGVLADVLRGYAEFLAVPITVEGEPQPINGRPAPWAVETEPGPARTALYLAWVEERRGVRPLSVLPLEDVATEDGKSIPLRGALYVPPRSIISIQEFGDVTVYVRRMLITENDRDLLPDWARFVSGVIDCPLLNPTASRETLRHDEVYAAVQEGLARQLLAHFERVASEAPLDWAAIVQAHNDLIKGWAVRSPELFLRVADLVSFRTSRGTLTLPEYLHENPGRIFYYDEDEGVTQALALFEARRLAVVDARWFADTAFLKRYGEIYGVPVEELEPGAGYLFTPVEDPDGRWQPVLDACHAEGFPARLLAFEPEHLPMILLYPPGAERLRRARKNVAEGRFNSPIRRLVRGYVERQQVDEAMLKGVLHLNARNALLRRVRDLGTAHPQFTPLVSILVANARVFAGQGLSAQDTIACFEQVNRSLSRLVGLDLGEDGALSVALLAELGLSQEAAGRLCAACETVQALLDADIATLAERTRLSPLMLATIREELKARQVHDTEQPAGTTAPGATQPTTAGDGETETTADGDGRRKPKIVALRDRKARPAGDERAGSTDAGGEA
jgi:molecular chaperone HtpG